MITFPTVWWAVHGARGVESLLVRRTTPHWLWREAAAVRRRWECGGGRRFVQRTVRNDSVRAVRRTNVLEKNAVDSDDSSRGGEEVVFVR